MADENTVIAKPGNSVSRASGENFTLVVPSPRCFVDSHSHIENGACAPLPLLWAKSIVATHAGRKWVDLFAYIIMPKTGFLQVKSTAEIGSCAVAAIDDTFGLKSE